MKGELREGIIQFPLGNYNLEILVKNNEIKDYTAEQTKNRFEKIYYCHNNPEKDIRKRHDDRNRVHRI